MSKDTYIRQLQMESITASSMKNDALESMGINIAIRNAKNNEKPKAPEMSEADASLIGGAIGGAMGALVAPLKAAKEENAYFKEQLSRPLMEIINENKEYKDAFEKQREILEGWMVSQNAFKKLALEYGKKSGQTEEDIKDEVTIEKEKVIASGVITKINGDFIDGLRVLNKK